MNIFTLIPTYNERENVVRLINALLKLSPPLNILVVDDNSPDGTARLVQENFSHLPQVHVLLRKKDKGRGLACREGFQYVLQMGADYCVEMDADMSHDPQHIPEMIQKAREFDVVIGSRFLSMASDERHWRRKLISRLARFYLKHLLGIRASDPTSGYRCFSRRALQTIDVTTLRSRDPFIITEVLYRCYQRKLRLGEIPIVMKKRMAGQTKLRLQTLLGYLFQVIRLRFSG